MRAKYGAVLLTVLLLSLLAGCGLDTFYYLDAPLSSHSCTASQTEDAQLYVSFLTSELTENNSLYVTGSADFTFSGTAVYYCIYDSTSALASFSSVIASLNSSSSYSSAAERLLSAGYQPLSLSTGSTPNPLVVQGAQNRYVYVRLASYGDTDAYRAALRVSTGTMQQSTDGADLFPGATPCRITGGSFDFSKDGVPLPSSSDSDVRLSASGTPETYYVDLYAFSVGQDTTFARSYSTVTHLGTIPVAVSGSGS